MEEKYTITDEELIDRIDENIGEYELLCECVPDDCTYDERVYPKRRKIYFEHILSLIRRQQEKIKSLETEKEEAYQKGFSDGCDYETKVEDLVKINEDLQKQVTDLSAKRKRILANKVYSDATLKKWTKADLIEQIRILEHNWAATAEALNNSAKNSEQIFFEQKAEIDQLRAKVGAYEKSDFFKEAYIDQLKTENSKFQNLLESAEKALDVKADIRQQIIANLVDAFANCCCELTPMHGCSCSCEACLASAAADAVEGIAEGYIKEVFEKIDAIMNSFGWDFERFQDTAVGKKVYDLAKEYGVSLLK